MQKYLRFVKNERWQILRTIDMQKQLNPYLHSVACPH